jgi:hypothetical protein
MELMMSDENEIGGGQNSRPLNDTIAGTGPGIPDDAMTPGQEPPEPPSDEEVLAVAQKLHAPIPGVIDTDD